MSLKSKPFSNKVSFDDEHNSEDGEVTTNDEQEADEDDGSEMQGFNELETEPEYAGMYYGMYYMLVSIL